MKNDTTVGVGEWFLLVKILQKVKYINLFEFFVADRKAQNDQILRIS